jgi:hypothetical protein
MLGDKIGEASGKITNVRVLDHAGAASRIEVSFQGQGSVGSVAITDIGSYWQEFRGSGFYGEGGPLLMSADGDLLSWKGFGAGRPTGPGFAANFAVCGVIQTSSTKFSHLDGVAAVGEYDTQENGDYHWTLWEWKPKA